MAVDAAATRELTAQEQCCDAGVRESVNGGPDVSHRARLAVARPSKPRISRAAVIHAAIELVDEEGLDSFNLGRLAQRLGVSTPSLYHHFTDRSEILNAVAHHLAGESITQPPRSPGPDWPEYFVSICMDFRTSILRHRNSTPILIEYLPLGSMVGTFEDAARFLSESGVPEVLHLEIIEGMEALCLGTILLEAFGNPKSRYPGFDTLDSHDHPFLTRALQQNEFTATAMFGERIRSFLTGVIVRQGL
ncbi:regulatory protein TetR [Mycolicibacterium rhodesiae JS60]|nr:regulatory protein TetR [Mycolicibacterium rhodesiae JS60]